MSNKETMEIFAGTKSFSKVAEKNGFNVWTTDIQGNHNLLGNILDIGTQKIIIDYINTNKPLFVWLSPVCTGWSMSAGNTHWTAYRQPKTQKALDSINMMMFCRLIADIQIKAKRYFIIENPRARARWILDNQYRHTIWYCQYGDSRAKPTDIWTNLPNFVGKMCHNGNKDCQHEPAPRGSKTGTQGLKGNKERSVVPEQFCQYVCDLLNEMSKDEKIIKTK